MQKFEYMMLGRLKMDCEYFLGNGNRSEKCLWAGDVHDQIVEMKRLYDVLSIKPIWLTLSDIERYEKLMQES